MKPYLIEFDNINITIRAIGNSVIRIETAIFIPSTFPYFKVSEKTKARRGPGDVPAAKPKTIPEIRNSSPSVMFCP